MLKQSLNNSNTHTRNNKDSDALLYLAFLE